MLCDGHGNDGQDDDDDDNAEKGRNNDYHGLTLTEDDARSGSGHGAVCVNDVFGCCCWWWWCWRRRRSDHQETCRILPLITIVDDSHNLVRCGA